MVSLVGSEISASALTSVLYSFVGVIWLRFRLVREEEYQNKIWKGLGGDGTEAGAWATAHFRRCCKKFGDIDIKLEGRFQMSLEAENGSHES